MRKAWRVVGGLVLAVFVLIVLWHDASPGGGSGSVPGPSAAQDRPAGVAEDPLRGLIPWDLEGRVYDEQGRPISGARVEPRAEGWLPQRRELLQVIRGDGDPAPPPPRHRGMMGLADPVLTDERGAYQFLNLGSEGPDVVLEVTASGYVGQAPHLFLSPGLTPFDVTLRPAVPLSGTVVDESGQPIADVELGLRGPPTETPPPPDSARSDTQGRFHLWTARAGDAVLTMQHADFLPSEQSLRTPSEGLRLVLRSGLSLEVELVDEAGHPVPGATVFVQRDPPEDSRPPARLDISSTLLAKRGNVFEDPHTRALLTDGAGKVAFKGLEPGRYVVAAAAEIPGYVRTVRREVESPQPGPRRLRLPLPPGLRLTGVVVDRSGRPLKDVEVRVTPLSIAEGSPEPRELDPTRDTQRAAWRGEARVSTALAALNGDDSVTDPATQMALMTGRNGRFSVKGLSPGPHFVTAIKPGYGFKEGKEQGVRASGGTRDVRVQLHRLPPPSRPAPASAASGARQ